MGQRTRMGAPNQTEAKKREGGTLHKRVRKQRTISGGKINLGKGKHRLEGGTLRGKKESLSRCQAREDLTL